MRSNASYLITPDAFSVHPALVGRPLARPARRLGAMLLDLFIVTVLVQMAGATLLGLAAAWFAFRAAGRLPGTTARLPRMVRLGVRTVGAIILFVVATRVWGSAGDALRSRVSVVTANAVGGDSAGMRALVGMGAQVSTLQRTDDEAEARRMVGELAAGFRRAGLQDEQVDETLRDLVDDQDEQRREWLGGIITSTLAAPADTARRPASAPDSLARAYAAALESGDTAAARALRPRVASALARDSLDHLRGQVDEARRERREVAARLEQVEERGFLRSLLHFLDDLGIGFGWSGLYFTAFIALWNGQTPAKRLLGVRVVRLDGKPMTWWSSFERFGGYAAGLVTGLLGFAQVYWDRNRQMIHDKIVETVVVREQSGAPTPTPAPAAAPPSMAPAASPARHTDPPRA
ncbi:MAG TPA: RDD family protein [Longimicrobium sp.]